jgi:hypothetical protein
MENNNLFMEGLHDWRGADVYIFTTWNGTSSTLGSVRFSGSSSPLGSDHDRVWVKLVCHCNPREAQTFSVFYFCHGHQRRSNSGLLIAVHTESCVASLGLGFFPRVRGRFFNQPRKEREWRGLGRGKFHVGYNRTPGNQWAGVKSFPHRSTRVDWGWAAFPAGLGLTKQSLRHFTRYICVFLCLRLLDTFFLCLWLCIMQRSGVRSYEFYERDANLWFKI